MELIRACGPQASVMLCGFKCHGPKWSLLRHKNNQYAALISTASAAHISNNTLHDTQDTHMCAHVHFSSRFYAVTHENMHNFINDSCNGERERRAWEKRNRQDAATWWIQALQMRGAQTSREERGEAERQRAKERQNGNGKEKKKKGKIQSSASKQIKEKCEKQKRLIKKKKGGVRD